MKSYSDADSSVINTMRSNQSVEFAEGTDHSMKSYSIPFSKLKHEQKNWSSIDNVMISFIQNAGHHNKQVH